MKKIKVEIDGKEVEVVLASEAESFANQQAANARVEEKNKFDALKAEHEQLKTTNAELTEKATKFDTVAAELEMEKGNSASTKKFLDTFKLFEAKVPVDVLEDLIHIPLLKDADLSDAEKAKEVRTKFAEKYPSYFTASNESQNKEQDLSPLGGGGGGANSNGKVVKSIADIPENASKAEINAMWDKI